MASNAEDTAGRLNLLDRLLEVAKDFEAERFQDEVEHKKQVRSLEQQVRTLRETSENRLNEITYLETKLGKANDQIVQLQEQNKRSLEDNEKTNLIREIVALRFIVADLFHTGGSQGRTAKDTADSDDKENSVGKGNASAVVGKGDDAFLTKHHSLATMSADTKDVLSKLCSRREFYKAACHGDKDQLLAALQPDVSFQNEFFDLVNTALVKSCTGTKRSSPGNDEVANSGALAQEDESTKKVLEQGTKMEVLDLLLGAGATMSARDEQGTNETILHGAAGSGSIAVVETILAQEGVEVNATDIGGRTPLHAAVENADVVNTTPVIKALLMAGCDPTAKTNDGVTAEEMIRGKCDANVAKGKAKVDKSDNKQDDDDDVGSDGDDDDFQLVQQRLKSALDMFSDPTVLFWNCSVRAFDAYSNEDFRVALDVYAQAIKLVQDNGLPVSKEDQSRLYYNRARALTHLDCRVKATADLESALELAPNYTNARALLAQCRFDLYQYDRCVQGLKLVLDVDPNNKKWNKLIVEARRLRDANHYEVLGIERNADEKDIKKAYRSASKKWHPDKHQGHEDNKARANTMFKRVNEANQILGDSYKKLLYDVELNKRLETELQAMEQMRQREEEHARRTSYTTSHEYAVPRRPSAHGGKPEYGRRVSRNDDLGNLHSKHGPARTSMGGARDMFNEVFSRRQDVDYGDGVANQWQRVSVDTAGTYGSALDSDYYEEHTEDEDEEELFGY